MVKKTPKPDSAASSALLKRKPKPKKASSKSKSKSRLTNAKLLELAAKRKPPQSWYDEDFDGI